MSSGLRRGGAARATVWAGAGLVALVVVFWAARLLGGEGPKALDAYEYHYPTYVWLYGEIAEGRLPLWNPYQLCGIPTFDTLQSGVLYPLHFLYALLPTDDAMAISGLLHLVLVAITTYVFVLRAGLGVVPALVAGLLVATRGAQPGHVANPSMQEAGAWLALGFVGVLEAARGRPLHGGLWVATATAMSLLAGFPQLSVYSAYAWGLGAIALSMAGWRDWRGPARAAAGVVAGVGLGALIAAVALLPALDLSAIGSRERGTLALDQMLPFGLAGFESPPRALRSVLASRPAAPGVSFTFGVLGIALAAAAPFASRARRLGLVMLGLGALALIFALGPATPVFELLLRLPELGTFRNPWRVLFVADFAIAVAAAVGLAGLLARLERHVPAAGVQRGRRMAGVAGVAVAAVLLESVLAPGEVRRLPYDATSPLLAPYHERRAVLDALARRSDRVFTIFAGDMRDVSEKLAGIFRVRSVSDNEIMTLRRQRSYFTWLYWGDLEPSAKNAKGYSQRVFYGHYDLTAPGIDPTGVASRNRLLEIAAARYVLAPRSAIGQPPVATYLQEAGVRAIDGRDRQLVVFEQPRALPRAYLSHAVAPSPPVAELLATISRPDFDPRRLSYVEAGDAPLPDLGEGSPDDRVEIVEDGLEHVTLRVRLAEPALVVLADTYHPAWTAEVDGAATTVLPTNHLFRGVVAPAGEHEIHFRYRPTSVQSGAALSALGLVTLVAGAAWLRLRARRPAA